MKKNIAKQKTITVETLLAAINNLEGMICIEGFSTVMNWKESLGFERSQEAVAKKSKRAK
jgi:hypothetical protein